MIKHNPIYRIDDVIRHYSDKDGVPITYVCTTEIEPGSCVKADVFYRQTPHPEFGNRYFGLYRDFVVNTNMITSADSVEELTFACVEDSEGGFHYSRDRYDCVTTDAGNMVDGGRAYVRTNVCEVFTYTVKDGRMVPFDGRMRNLLIMNRGEHRE